MDIKKKRKRKLKERQINFINEFSIKSWNNFPYLPILNLDMLIFSILKVVNKGKFVEILLVFIKRYWFRFGSLFLKILFWIFRFKLEIISINNNLILLEFRQLAFISFFGEGWILSGFVNFRKLSFYKNDR